MRKNKLRELLNAGKSSFGTRVQSSWPSIEIASVDQAKYYLDMGVQHFNLGLDISILFNWLKENGNALRKVVSDT